MDERTQDTPTEPAEYEAPRAEDVSNDDAPSVTAAGETKSVGAG